MDSPRRLHTVYVHSPSPAVDLITQSTLLTSDTTPVRLVGGILTIVQGQPANRENLGLIIAAIVFLGIGVIPLIISTLGLLRLVIHASFQETARVHFAVRAIRLLFLVAVVLLTLSGSLLSSDSLADAAHDCGKAGYIIFLTIVVLEAALEVYLLRRKSQISSGYTAVSTQSPVTVSSIPLQAGELTSDLVLDWCNHRNPLSPCANCLRSSGCV